MRFCPYCDEPLPPTAAARYLWQIALWLALGGFVIMRAARPEPAAIFPLAWPATPLWLLLAGICGAVSGLCHGIPLPLLTFAAGLPLLPQAAMLGAYAATSSQRLRGCNAQDPTALPFASQGDPMPVVSTVMAAGIGWLLTGAAYLFPHKIFSIMLVVRAHAAWLLAAGILTTILLTRHGGAIPSLRRSERLRHFWLSIGAALVFTLFALVLGWQINRLPRPLLAAAAAGAYAVAPLLWRAAAGRPLPLPLMPLQSPHRDTVLRTVVLALLTLVPLTASDDPYPASFIFAAAATLAALPQVVKPFREYRSGILTGANWVPAALTLIWAGTTCGLYGLGLAALTAALLLWAALWSLPQMVLLAPWLPILG